LRRGKKKNLLIGGKRGSRKNNKVGLKEIGKSSKKRSGIKRGRERDRQREQKGNGKKITERGLPILRAQQIGLDYQE